MTKGGQSKPPEMVQFLVMFDLPEGATAARAREYVADALATMSGSLRPDGWDGPNSFGDPMQRLNSKSIKIQRKYLR